MEKDLIVRQTYDFYDGIIGQDIIMDNEEVFSAYNLNECPEDAIISRDLFNAWDFIKAIELGMKLAKEGYVKLNITTAENEE